MKGNHAYTGPAKVDGDVVAAPPNSR